MSTIIRGTARKFGDNINADHACQHDKNRYIDFDDTEKLAAICMTGYDPEFSKRATRGDILVAGKNFASGHMHPPFWLSLKAFGIAAVVVESMNRRFYREAINSGMPVTTCSSTKRVQEGDEIEVNLKDGLIRILKSNEIIEGETLSPVLYEIVERGGLANYLRERLHECAGGDTRA